MVECRVECCQLVLSWCYWCFLSWCVCCVRVLYYSSGVARPLLSSAGFGAIIHGMRSRCARRQCAHTLYTREIRSAGGAGGHRSRTTTPAYSLRIARCRDSRGQQRGARVHKLGTGARHRHAAARGGHAPPAHPSDPRSAERCPQRARRGGRKKKAPDGFSSSFLPYSFGLSVYRK